MDTLPTVNVVELPCVGIYRSTTTSKPRSFGITGNVRTVILLTRRESVFKLVQTCSACPEQYDVFLKDDPTEMVGYLRLRHGHFRAEHMGQTVYESTTKGDGIFDSDERSYHLNQACLAIKDAMDSNVEIEYEIEGTSDEEWFDYE